MKRRHKIVPLILFIIIISMPQISGSAFYEYVDENGTRHFTDYQGDIPENTYNKAVEHKDKYDYMSGEDKKKALKEAELQRSTDEKNQQRRRQKTRVVIQNNQIHVPVTIKANGNSVTTILLLDTGANSTVIHDSVARQLDLKTISRGYARTAGGGVISTSMTALDSIHVGPKTRHDTNILVMEYKGPPGKIHGLLGMDFLKHFKYSIDVQNNYINWIN